MESFFNKLTDIGLRRLYKFILKRTIGVYLESELLIEQLQVSSREGLVTLNDLKLNCDLINEDYLSCLPFKVVSFRISKLQGTVSYAAVLHDGCRFSASNIEIVLEPIEADEVNRGDNVGKSKTEHDQKKKLDSLYEKTEESFTRKREEDKHTGKKGQTEEGQEGLNFLANWIEVVLARLEVSVQDVYVTIQDTKVSQTSFMLHLSQATFFNTNPKMFGSSESTVMAASLRMTPSSSTSSSSSTSAHPNIKMAGSRTSTNLNSTSALDSKKKLLKFESFELSIRSNDIDHKKSRTASSQPISRVFLKSFVGGYFSLNSIFRPDNGVRGGYVECTDFDVHIPDLLLEFDEISLKTLLFLVSVLSPSSSVSKSNSAGDVTAEGQLKGTGKGKGKRTERTQWETDLNIDLDEIPKATLRTLLWLEKQSAQPDTGTGAGAGVRVGEREGEEGDDDLDYDRLRELMTKYLLSKKSLEEDAVITKTIKEHSSRPLSNLAETLCDSDSGEDFPDDTHSDSDFADVEGEEEWEGEDGSEFQDAAEGRGWSMGQSSIRRVKMGQVCSDLIGDEKGATEALQDRGRRQTKGSASRSGMSMDMSMSHSVYGAKSIATMDSGMFHSTREGSSFSPTNKGGLTGSTESGFYHKINKETRIRMHLAVVKVRLRDLAVLSTTHDHVSTVETPDVADIVPMSTGVSEEVTEAVIDGCDTVSRGEEVAGGGDGEEVGGREGEKGGEGGLEEKNTDALTFIPTLLTPDSSLPPFELSPLPPSTIPSAPSSIPPLSTSMKSPTLPSMKSPLPGAGSVRVTVRELILRMDSVIISTTLSQGGQGQRTSSDGACDCPEVSFSAGTVDASENTVSYIQDSSTQPIGNIDLSSNDVMNDTKDDSHTNSQGDGEAEHESAKNAEHAPTFTAFPIYNTREEHRTVISTLSFLSFQTLADEHGEGQDGVSGVQTSRARTLISAPHVEGTFKFCPATHTSSASSSVGALPSRSSSTGSDGPPVTARGQPTIALDIHLEPLVLSVRQRTVLRWKAILDDVMGTLPPTKSHTKMTLQLNAPVVDLYVHCDPHFYTSIDTCASQSNLRSEGDIRSESPAGTEAGQGQGQGTGTEERVISGIEELLIALNISPWNIDIAPSKWKELIVRPLGGCEYPYKNQGENKRKDSWSSSTPRAHDSADRSYDDDPMKDRDRDRERERVRAGRMGEISSTEREHVGSSPAGFHMKSSAVTVTIDSNSSSSGAVRGRDISRDHGSKDRNTGSRTSSPSPRNATRITKSPSRTSTDDDGSVLPLEGASLGGTGLKVTMKKLSGRMFFAATRDDTSYENSFDGNTATGAEEKKTEEIESEKEGMQEGRQRREGTSVALLEYPLFDMRSDVDTFDIITLSNNVANPTMQSRGTGAGTGTGSGTGDTSGTPVLSAPVIPFKDVFYFNAHLIDLDLGHTEFNVVMSLLEFLSPPLSPALPLPLPLPLSLPSSLPSSLPVPVVDRHSTPTSTSTTALPLPSSPSAFATALPSITLSPKATSKEPSLGLILNAGMIRIRLTENESTVMPNHGNASNTSPKHSSNTKNNNNNKSTRVEGNYFDFSCASCILENTELVFIRTSHRQTLKHYFSFTAEDFSLFELSEDEYRESYRQGSSSSGSSGSSGSGRAGSSVRDDEKDSHSFKKCSAFPFLFGTSFHRNSSVISDGDSSSELALQRNVLPSEYKERFMNKNKDKEKEECKRKKSPVVLFQVLMAEEKDWKDKDKNKGVGMGKGKEEEKKGGRDASGGDAGTRSVSVCIEFSNITHKHNPQSNFIPKITRLLSLCPPSQIIQNREIKKRIMSNREERSRVVEMCGTDINTDSDSRVKESGNVDGAQLQSQSSALQESVKTTEVTLYSDTENTVIENKSSILMDEIQAPSPPSPLDLLEKKKVLQFSMTKIIVRVHKLCVDYECSTSASTSSSSSTSTSTSSLSRSSMQSRMLLSLGSMSLSTTIANNSNCYLFKVSVKDLVLHLSNHILRNPLFEQNPLNINGSRNMITDTTTQKIRMVAIDGALQSGGRQGKQFTLDFDRFLDEHDLIQVVSVDDVTALVGFNPPKQSSGGVSEDLGPDSYSISHQKGQSDCDSEKEKEKKAEKGVGVASVVDARAGGEEMKTGGTVQASSSTSKSAARVGTTDTSVELTLGLCCVYVCMDSVDVLTKTMTEWVRVRQVTSLSLKRSEEEYYAVQSSLEDIGIGLEAGGGEGEGEGGGVPAVSALPTTSVTSYKGQSGAVTGHVDNQSKDISKHADMMSITRQSQSDTISTGPLQKRLTKDSFPSNLTASGRHGNDEGGNQRIGDDMMSGREVAQPVVPLPAAGTVNKAKATGHVMTATIIEEYYTAPAPTIIASLPSHPVLAPGMLQPPFRTPSPEYEARWLPRYDYGGDTGGDDVDSFGCDTEDDDDDIVAIEEGEEVEAEAAGMGVEGQGEDKESGLGANKTWDTDSMGDLLLMESDLPPTPATASPTQHVQTFSVLSSFSSVTDPQASPSSDLPHPVTPGLFAWNASEDLIQNIDSDDDLSIEGGLRNGVNSLGTGSLGSYGVTLLSVEESVGDGEGVGGMHGRQGIDLWEGNCLEPTALKGIYAELERDDKIWSDEEEIVDRVVAKKDEEIEKEEDIFSGADSNLNNLNAFNFNCGTDTDSDEVEGEDESEGVIGMANMKGDSRAQTLQKYSDRNMNMNMNVNTNTNSMNSYNGYDINATDINTDYNNNSYINFNFNTVDDASEGDSDNSADSDSGAANEERGRFKPDFDFDFDFNFNELGTADDTGVDRNISASRLVSSVMNVGKWNSTKSNIAESVFGFDAFSSLSRSTAAAKVPLEDFELRTYRERGTYGDSVSPTIAPLAGSELNVLNLSNFNFNEELEVEKEVVQDSSNAFQMSELEFFCGDGDDMQTTVLEPLDVDAAVIPSSTITSSTVTSSSPSPNKPGKKKKKKSARQAGLTNIRQDSPKTFPATYVDIFGFSDEEDDGEEEDEEEEDEERSGRNRDNSSVVEEGRGIVSGDRTDSFRSIEGDHLALHVRGNDQNEDSPVSCDFLSLCGDKEAEAEAETGSGAVTEDEDHPSMEAEGTLPAVLADADAEAEGEHVEEELKAWPPLSHASPVEHTVPVPFYLPPSNPPPVPFNSASAPPLPLTPAPAFSLSPPPIPSAGSFNTATVRPHLSFPPPLKVSSSTPPLFDFSPSPHPFKFPPPLPPSNDSSPSSPRPPPFCFSGPPSVPSTPPAPLPLCFGPPPSSNPPPFCFKVPPPLQFSFTHTPSTSTTSSRFIPGPAMLPTLPTPKPPTSDLMGPFTPLANALPGTAQGLNKGSEGQHSEGGAILPSASASASLEVSTSDGAPHNAINAILAPDPPLSPFPLPSISKSNSGSNSKGKPLTEQKAQWFIDPADVQVKQHHIPLPVKSDIKRFEDSLPVHERALDVALIVTVRASLQIRVFGGTDWEPAAAPRPSPSSTHSEASRSPVEPATLSPHAQTGALRKDSTPSTATARRVDFAFPTPAPAPTPAGSAGLKTDLRTSPAAHRPSQAQRIKELTDVQVNTGTTTSSSNSSNSNAGVKRSRAAAPAAVSDLLFDRPDPVPSVPGLPGSKRRSTRVSRRELEHMLDLSTKNVVLAVRYYQPLTAHLPSSAGTPTTASSSARPVLSSASYPAAAMTSPAVAIVYPASPSTIDSEDSPATVAGASADPTSDLLDVVLEKNKASDLTGSRSEKGSQGGRGVEDVGGLKDDHSPLIDSIRVPKKDTVRPPVLPVQRIILSTEDLVLSFGRAGRRRRRVLGRWRDCKPGDRTSSDIPLVRLSVAGYETNNAPRESTQRSDDDRILKSKSNHADDSVAGRSAGVGGERTEKKEEELGLEFRVSTSLLPLRCYLDAHFVQFLRDLGKLYDGVQVDQTGVKDSYSDEKGKQAQQQTQKQREKERASRGAGKEKEKGVGKGDDATDVITAGPYFQHVWIAPIMLKIDYEPGTMDLQELQGGDYMQLLNFFPLHKMKICLRDFKAMGVTGTGPVMMRALESWVTDIYSNQMHQIICGAAPFRGLSNVGAGLHDLMLIPLKDFTQQSPTRAHTKPSASSAQSKASPKGQGNMMKELRKTSSALLHTVTKDALTATSKLTMMLARGISDLASDSAPAPERYRAPSRGSRGGSRTKTAAGPSAGLQGYHTQREQLAENKSIRQPAGVRDGLEKALDSVTREVYSAVETVICIPVRDYTRTGPGGFVTSVVRALPIAVLRPVAGAAEAISYALLGMRNSLDPDSRRDEEDIWNLDFDTRPLPKIKGSNN